MTYGPITSYKAYVVWYMKLTIYHMVCLGMINDTITQSVWK